MTNEIFFDGVKYISASDAARFTGFTRGYVARIGKEGKVLGRRIGKNWYISEESMRKFVSEQSQSRQRRTAELVAERRAEYQNSAASNTPEHTAIISPAVGFSHKLVALVVAVVFTVGTYAFVDAEYARIMLRDAPGAASSIVESARVQLAAVAEDPPRAFGEMLAGLARAINTGVNAFVYNIAFPEFLIPRYAGSSSGGAVSVRVSPRTSPAVSPTPSSFASAIEAPAPQSGQTIVRTVTNQIIERVIEERIISAGGISEDILNARLEQLDNKLASQIYAVSAQSSSNTTSIAQNYLVTAQTNKIDQLSGVAISGGTITGADISGGSISGTTLSASGSTGLATTSITGGLTVTNTSTSTFSGGISALYLDITGTSATSTFGNGVNLVGGCVSVNGTCLGSASVAGSDTEVQFNDSGTLGASSNFTFSTSSNRLSVGAASTTRLSVFDRLYVGGSATTTIQGETTGTSTLQGFLSVAGTNSTSTFSGGLTSVYLNVTGTAATSTFARGIDLAGGCFSVNGTCLTSGSQLLATANTWTALQLFSAGASTTNFSNFGTAYFGGTATSSFSSAGALTLTGITNSLLSANATGVVGATTTPTAQYFIATSTATASTFPYASTTALTVSGTSFLTNIFATASSTIGGGTQTTGLTISGGATTTGNVYAGGYFDAAASAAYKISGSTVLQIMGQYGLVLGANAMAFNTSSFEDTVVGTDALNNALTSSGNVAIGYFALTGNLSATNTVAIGDGVGYGLGSYSNQGGVIIGALAGQGFQTGSDYNTLIGYKAGQDISTGAGNTIVGATFGTNNLSTGSRNIGIGYDIGFASSTASYQLVIGNLIYGTGLNGTSTTLSTGNIGIGTTTPWAKLSIHANSGDTNTTLFAIASSTASATTTLFSISNTGVITSAASATSTFTNGIAVTGGCVSVEGTCLGSSGVSLSAANTWTALQSFSAGASTTRLSVFDKAYFGGSATSTFSSDGSLNVATAFTAYASSTIGDGTQAGGLTIFGGATTTGALAVQGTATSTFAGNVLFGTTTLAAASNMSRFLFDTGGITGAARGLEIYNPIANAAFTGTGGNLVINNAGGSGTIGAPALNVVWSGSSVAQIMAIGNIIAGVTNGQVGNPGFAFIGDTDTGMYSNGSGQLSFGTNGTQRAYFDTSGNFNLVNSLITPDISMGSLAVGTTTATTTTNFLAIGGASAYVPAGGTIAFLDTFTEAASDTNLDLHTPDTGTSWTVATGTAVMRAQAASDTADATVTTANIGVLYTANATMSSADYQVQITAGTVTSSDDILALAARVQDADNMYLMKFSSTAANNQLYKNVSGTWTLLGTAIAGVTSGDVLKLRIVGSKIVVYKNNTLMMQVNDSSITGAGKAGMGLGSLTNSSDDTSTVWNLDDFTVTEYDGFVQTAYFTDDCTVSTCVTTKPLVQMVQTNVYSTGPILGLNSSVAGASGLSIQIASSSANAYALNITSNNGAITGLKVLADGNVGIGTTTPYHKLTIWGSDTSANTTSFLVSDSASTTIFKLTNNGQATFNYASTTALTASGTGFFGLGAFTNTSGTTTIASGQGFTIGGSQFVLQQGSGNVGIGTTTPYSKLTIWGSDASANTTSFLIANSASTTLFSVPNATTGTSTFATGLAATYLDVTGTAATSTFARGINLAGGCFAVNGTCVGGGSDTVVRLSAVRTYGSTDTWTKPADFSYAVVEIWGGGATGGDGKGGNIGGGGGGGGGSGGYAQEMYTASTLSAVSSLTATVGAAGGTSNFGGMATSTGGSAGSTPTTEKGGAGGAGGSGSGGDINLTGAPGDTGGSGNSDGISGQYSGGTGGTGGTAPRGGGGGQGGAGGSPVSTNGTTGSTGLVYGGGGGGGGGTGGSGGANIAGAAGAAGGIVVYEYTTVASGADLAENYPVSDPSVGSGDIVAFDIANPLSVKRAVKGDGRPLAGIISTRPGVLLDDGQSGAVLGQRPVALAGRVPTKVNLEGGAIAIGDRITVSSVPGVGKKASIFDDAVAVALTPYDGTSDENTVMAFIDLERGVDINSIATGLLGSSFVTNIASTTAASTGAMPLDFVGGVMQAIASRLATLTGTSASSTGATSADATASSTLLAAADPYAGGFLQGILGRITDWFADAANGIGDFFANRVHTKELCVGDESGETCVTRAQLDTLIAGASGSSSDSSGGSGESGSSLGSEGGGGESSEEEIPPDTSSGSAQDEEAPVITLNGANPADINVGDTYADLGAIITDNVDQNIGIKASVDGGALVELGEIAIDTSVAGTHTIEYSATDVAGNTATSTRAVNVADPSSGAINLPQASTESIPSDPAPTEESPAETP